MYRPIGRVAGVACRIPTRPDPVSTPPRELSPLKVPTSITSSIIFTTSGLAAKGTQTHLGACPSSVHPQPVPV